jgi:hypothetical protein
MQNTRHGKALRSRFLRTYLLIIALATLAAAQATQPGIATQIINLPDTIKTTIDEISYSLVKQRTGFTQITVPLPAAAYKDYGNIQLIVIAIPYSPEEDPDQAIKEAIKELTKKDNKLDFGTKVRNAIERLLSIRSVFYPYETFKVRLIFIIFVHTQTLIDYAIEASANLKSGKVQGTLHQCLSIALILTHISQSLSVLYSNPEEVGTAPSSNPEKVDPEEVGAALYTNSIMEILYAKYQTWKSSEKPILVDKIRKFELNTLPTGDTIIFTGQVDGNTVLRFSVTVQAERNDNSQAGTKTICKLSSAVQKDKTYENFSDKLAKDIKTTLPTLKSEDLELVFAGIKNINNIVNEFNNEIEAYYTSVIDHIKTDTNRSIVDFINNNKLLNFETTYSCDNCDCENIKRQVIDSILQQLSSLASELINTYTQMLDKIDSKISECLGVVDNIKQSLLPDCGNDDSCKEIRNTLEEIGNTVASEIGYGKCIGKYLKEIAKSGVDALVSFAPKAKVIYILANGIIGALQNQVTITGEIVSEPVLAGGLRGFKVYQVSNRIACYSREISDIFGQNFVSKPSMWEAIFAAIKGFTSAVGQLFLGDLAKTVDLIPIIRTVDMPTDGYFMFTATPGVYVLKIDKLNARNIIDQFKQDMECGIWMGLAKSYVLGSKCELYKRINEKVKNVLGTTNLGNRAELYGRAYGDNYRDIYNSLESDTSTLTLSMYFVVIPPYMAGTRFGSGYNYTLVADLFGLLRSFLSPTIGDVRRQIVSSTNICPISTVRTSPGVVGGAIESACANIVRSAEGVVNNAMSRVINNLFKFEFHPKDQITCSLEDVLKYSVEAAIDAARKAIVTEISRAISDRLIKELFNSIERSVCSWLGDQVGNRIEQGLSSLLERLFDLYGTSGFQSQIRASYDSGSNKLTEAFCRLVGNPQIMNYLGLYAVRIFDAAEEGLYVPSYFLSAYPIQFKESPTARWCYSVVMSPYYIYKQPPLPTREKEVKSLLIDALDVIRGNDNLKTGFLNSLRDKYVQTKILLIFPWQDKAVKENNKVACDPWGIRIFPPGYNPYLDFNECWDRGNLRWTIDSLQLGHLSQSDMQFLRGLLMQRSRLIEVPVLAGVNKYFDAFKVYPAIAVREDGNPNPYYFVVPYSTPARELFVLGTVGDVVVYDGSLKTAGGDKPFLYYNVAR